MGIDDSALGFLRWASADPQRVALVDDDGDLAYAALRIRVLTLAARLQGMGARPGDVVAVACDRSIEGVVGMLAILSVGAAYLPLDVSYPAASLAGMVADAKPRLVVVGRDAPVELLRSLGLLTVESATTSDEVMLPEPVAVDPGATAYVIFTSGSTGRPKGVAMSRHALQAMIGWHLRHPRLRRPARTLQFLTFGFDPSVRDIFATLATGGTLLIAGEPARRDPFRLLEVMREQRIESVALPYVALRALARAHAEGGVLPDALRDVITGGEALAITPAIRDFFSALPGAVLHNQYGPTEACVFVTTRALDGDPAAWPERPDIGHALAHVRLHVVDEDLQPVPDGSEGELLIGGESLADGYINQPALTSERFRQLRFGDASPERVYCSGDRVRRGADGSIAFLGRHDEQVKIAGHRLELGEVETVLAAHEAVREVTVVAPQAADGPRLVAHVLLRATTAQVTDVRALLHQHLAANLPVFARPQSIVFRDVLPLMPSGKVDRARLELESAQHSEIEPAVRNWTSEERVATLWRQLLAKPSLDLDDNVFDHGADSLLVMVFVTRVRAALGAALSAAAVYELPTPRQQAQALAPVPLQSAEQTTRLDRSGFPNEVPLSEAQMEKWFASQFGETASLSFNESAVLHLDGALDVAVLKRALAMVWQRHESLRFTIAADGSSQRFHAQMPLPLAELDHSGLGERADAALDAFCAGQVARCFELSTGPLVRFTLVRLARHRHALHVISHHLVMDGWSLSLFVSELGACYNAVLAGREPELAPAGSFRRYVVEERRRRAAGSTAHSLDYWKQVYASPPAVLRLPADRPIPIEPDYAASTEHHQLSPQTTAALRDHARRLGVSLYSLLLSGFGVMVARLSAQRDFAIAVPFAGLALGDEQALMGDGVSALPLRMRVEPESSFGDLVRQTQASLLGAAEHQDTTLTGIQRMLGLRANGGEPALTGVMFNLLPNAPATGFEGLAHEVRECPRAALDWELYCNFSDAGGALAFDLHYATTHYDAQTVRRWVGFYATVLDTIAGCDGVSAPDAIAIDDIDLLSAAARVEVLETWNATEQPYDRELGLTTLIERQMRQTPVRIAAECDRQQMDYAALEHSTRALAQALGRRGIGRGDLVGVCVPRSLDMLIAVLGVLRSGAAYVPLDPEFPDVRLQHMAEHSGLRYVLMSEAGPVPAVIASGRTLLAVADLCAEVAEEQPLPEVHGDDLAYVLFTSGSTGEPKGVRILHRNLVNFLLSMRDEPGFGADDVLCAVTTLSFDIAGLELYLPLIAGGRLVIATEARHREPTALFELLERTQCTVLQTTPSLLQLLQGIGREDVVRQLRLFVGGEALPLTLAHAMAGQCSEFWNLYGPTETTIWSTTALIHPDVQVIPLGKPIANTRIYVLDIRGRPVPPGATGEIWIGGDGVSDGYLYRPEMTAERFVPDPFVGGDARMYRTGDLGSQREGTLYFHGRADDQIKIRGYRIEPGDIEAVAGADPAVHECVAVARRFGDNDLRLVLYVVADQIQPQLAEHLREVLRKRLPAYMRPQHIEILHALPKTPNGKIDRKALPSPTSTSLAQTAAQTEAVGSRIDIALADPRQEYLASIWRELVGVANVRGSDNFFDIGGHSLLAVEFTARVQRETGVRIGLLAVATSTLASLAVELPEADAKQEQKFVSLGARLRRILGFR